VRVVFLDFDGVLNSRAFLVRPEGSGDRLDPAAVSRLDQLAKRSGAKVVVTSTWRLKYSLSELSLMLREHGFEGEIIGATPALHLPGACDIEFVREQEIRSWLDEHPSVTDYVVLDDLFLEALAHVQVKTEFEEGLTEEHVEIALSVLGVDD